MEWEQLQQQAENYRLQLLNVDKWKKQHTTLEKLIQHANRELKHYESELIAAKKELQKLEKTSILNLFREWSGKKDELIEQRLDVVAVSELKFIEAQLTHEDLKDDLVDLVHKINAVNESYVAQELQKLERKRELWLMQHAPHVAEKLTKLLEDELLLKQLVIEIHEAIDAGKNAIRTLTDAAHSLKSASSYSTWDTYFGGGFIATALKHDKLDESNSKIHNAQISLQRFHNELLDVQQMKQDTLNIDTDGLVKFADYFFDDIFSAWSIHSKISTSMNQISRVQDDVNNTLQQLQMKLDVSLEKKQEIMTQKQVIY
ncbi:hypothetical protein CSE16_07770 [Solibacillus sp. R5-41]|uniref:hypothetical protein n=1 Tax=Solibacillus sp. R5-41 TaxID=2048654 RepID=UPI000C1284A5|nr:hypothetical protein [Solibacillus sp. R5-41]ATP39955.1 hypothetical protein CSE16_07770 [Solibacillus sp. R5-41]